MMRTNEATPYTSQTPVVMVLFTFPDLCLHGEVNVSVCGVESIGCDAQPLNYDNSLVLSGQGNKVGGRDSSLHPIYVLYQHLSAAQTHFPALKG
jgi:hypothetical protein